MKPPHFSCIYWNLHRDNGCEVGRLDFLSSNALFQKQHVVHSNIHNESRPFFKVLLFIIETLFIMELPPQISNIWVIPTSYLFIQLCMTFVLLKLWTLYLSAVKRFTKLCDNSARSLWIIWDRLLMELCSTTQNYDIIFVYHHLQFWLFLKLSSNIRIWKYLISKSTLPTSFKNWNVGKGNPILS